MKATGTRPTSAASVAPKGPAKTRPLAIVPESWLIALLFLAAAIAYFPAWTGQPIWDDDAHMTRRDLRSFDGLVSIWTDPSATQQYYPVTSTVFWLENKLWGESPLGHHLTNIFLHALSALLLMKILGRLQVPGAWLAAAIFALHPVHVESVAWISELKNTLSGLCYVGAALIYLKFDAVRDKKLYAISLAIFLLGLFSKSVIASLPAALLVIFWWRRGTLSWRKDVLPLLPFFAVGIAAGFVTAWLEREMVGAHGGEFNLTLLERCLVAGRAFWFYLGKLCWPAPLIFIYPRWSIDAHAGWQYVFPLAALALVLSLWTLRRRYGRSPLAAVLFFGGTLFPALGFINVYPFRYSFVANHFQYLASLGIIVLVSAGIALWLERRKPDNRFGGYAFCVAILLALGLLTWRQSAIYKNVDTLWADTLVKNPNCWLAHNNIGSVLYQQNDLAGAESRFLAALAINPKYDESLANLGLVRARQGKNEEGIKYVQQALEMSPEKINFRMDLGYLLAQDNQLEKARVEFLKVAQDKPHYLPAHLALGRLFMELGNATESIRHQKEAIRLSAESTPPEAYVSLADLLYEQNEFEEAATYYAEAAKLRPGDARIEAALQSARSRQRTAKK
ncbi:MAG: Tetratricopeptide 2 repeat protein [Pedosphaera sp.]|nr:Tetratricopeptide 2 repeat protein [Pedosphaera sp.]